MWKTNEYRCTKVNVRCKRKEPGFGMKIKLKTVHYTVWVKKGNRDSILNLSRSKDKS